MLKKVAMFAVVLGLAAPAMAQTEEAGKAKTEETKAAHATGHAKKSKGKKKDAAAATPAAAEKAAPANEAAPAPAETAPAPKAP